MLIAGGFILGLLVGRWALVAAVGVGVWVAVYSEVDVPGWFLGIGYCAVASVGIGASLLVRRALGQHRHQT